MEHLFHFFGGGCGEHLILPALISGISGAWISFKFYLSKFKKENHDSCSRKNSQ